MLCLIVLLYQHGANSVVTGIYPDFMRLILVENLQDRGTGEGFLQLLEGGFFFSSSREAPVLFCQVGQQLGDHRKALHESPVEVRQSQKVLHLPHTCQCRPR